MDVIAVKGFNIHKNRYRLLEEFKGLVKKCIDNADDLPKYEDQFAWLIYPLLIFYCFTLILKLQKNFVGISNDKKFSSQRIWKIENKGV